MMPEKRGILPRIGIVLLNFVAPGLGLLKLGRWRGAALLYGLVLVVMLFMRFGPAAPFLVWALMMILAIGVLVASFGATWFLSGFTESVAQNTKWPVVLGAAVLALALSWFLLDENKMAYRNFYTPAEGMAPTLPKGDRFVAYMRPAELKRGDVILVRTLRGDVYVKRLVGLPGDRIALTKGQVFLNERPIAQILLAAERVHDGLENVAAKRLAERLPGERSAHQVYDMGYSVGDNFGPMIIRPGHYFLLGDNRDRSADSRFMPEDFGLAQVPANDIAGRAMFHSWGSSKRIGTPIGGAR